MRRFLVVLVVIPVLVIAVFLLVAVLEKREPGPGPVERLALALDAEIEALPPPKRSRPNLRAWVEEILPWFEEEGIIESVRHPSAVRWVRFDGEEANHVLGTTLNLTEEVEVNARLASPESPWFDGPDLLATLAHELAHVQQGVSALEDDREVAAQVMSIEVLAAMANAGSQEARESVLYSLRFMALGSLRLGTLGGSREARERLDRLRRRVLSRGELAESDQRTRYWDARPSERARVLSEYSARPIRLLLHALGGDGVVRGPAFPRGAARVDDLAYFLRELGWSPEL